VRPFIIRGKSAQRHFGKTRSGPHGNWKLFNKNPTSSQRQSRAGSRKSGASSQAHQSLRSTRTVVCHPAFRRNTRRISPLRRRRHCHSWLTGLLLNYPPRGRARRRRSIPRMVCHLPACPLRPHHRVFCHHPHPRVVLVVIETS
jgi:hypothetical protein